MRSFKFQVKSSKFRVPSSEFNKYTNYQYTNNQYTNPPIIQNSTLKTQNSKLRTTHYPLHTKNINHFTHTPINPSTHQPLLPHSSSLLPIPCFILAGGKSSRFGKDKAYLFYDLQYNKCKQIFKKVYFTAKKKKFKNYPFFIEKSKIYAPIFALEELIKKYKKVFVLSIDTPFISEKSLKKLLINKAISKNNPLIGYYDYTMIEKLKKNKNKNLKISGINQKTIKIPRKELININKQEDLQINIPYILRQRFKRNIR